MKEKMSFITMIFVLFMFCLQCEQAVEKKTTHGGSLWPLYSQIEKCKYIDLTHTFWTHTPHWKGYEPMGVKDVYTINPHGFWVQEYTHVGQWGTHIDPPAHFHEGLRTVDQISPREMILPLVVIDVHRNVERNPDYVLSIQDILAWEQKYDRIPQGSFVAMRSDWSKRWPNDDAMQNRDENGTAHYPGWSLEALKFLYEQRGITASGHETTDTDPGASTSRDIYECESYILKTNHYQIELLTNLDQVPEYGSILICTFPKPQNGSGFPARLIAIVP